MEVRKWVLSELSNFRSSHGGKVLWVHVASLGEFEQGRPIIEKWRQYHPEHGIVLTFFSPSGYEVRKDYQYADLVTYLPLDTPRNARAFMKMLKPDIALFIKYEFWFNFLNEAVRSQVKVVFISTLFREDQIYFDRGRGLFIPLFRKFDHFFVQNERSKQILENHGVNAVTIAGDTRLDRVLEIKKTTFEHPEIEQFIDGKPVIVFGSTWYSDIEFLKPILPKLHTDFKLIFAPHHLDEDSLEQISAIEPEHTVLLSQYSIKEHAHTLIIDQIGSLSQIYRYARYAYIGGALHEGLHNILEPAVYGLPIFFARHPGNARFLEALSLEVSGGALSLEVAEEMLQRIEQLETDQEAYAAVGQKAADYVVEHAGATDVIFDYLRSRA